MLSFTIGRSSISVFLDGEFFSIDDSHANYPHLLDELKKPSEERDLDRVRSFVTVKRMIEALTFGRVSITDNEVLFQGYAVKNYMTQRMLEIVQAGLDIEPWAKFMDNLMDNPAPYAADELFQWMEIAKMPITPDGQFLAFKKVRDNYTDCHTGQFDNSVGCVIEMDRDVCDPNRHNHCSTGFHFCSVDYLRNFPGDRVMVVKINPRDVTAIPSDYSFTKGRCCRYEVVSELSNEAAARADAWGKPIVDIEDPAELPGVVVRPVVAAPVAAKKVAKPKSKKASAKKAVKGTQSPSPAAAHNDNLETFITADKRVISTAAILKALADNNSNRAAARALSIAESTLRGWLLRLSKLGKL